MKLVKTPPYLRAIKHLLKRGATAADIDVMEHAIGQRPESGDLVPGAGGLRKLRFGFGGRGKRGGGRTIYYVVTGNDLAFLVTAYAKAEQEDLSAAEWRRLTVMVRELEREQD